jgi:hypothetical protein
MVRAAIRTSPPKAATFKDDAAEGGRGFHDGDVAEGSAAGAAQGGEDGDPEPGEAGGDSDAGAEGGEQGESADIGVAFDGLEGGGLVEVGFRGREDGDDDHDAEDGDQERGVAGVEQGHAVAADQEVADGAAAEALQATEDEAAPEIVAGFDGDEDGVEGVDGDGEDDQGMEDLSLEQFR